MFTNTKAPKHEYERNAFDIKNSNRASLKAFTKQLADAPPEEAPAAPSMRNGKVEHPSVTLARQNMLAAKQVAQGEAAHNSRFQSLAQDTETVGALVKHWISATPGFVATPFNKESLTNAVNEWMLKGHALSIAALNQIFDVLVEGNYFERSGHARVRGESGIMVGRPTIYPVYETLAEQQQEAIQSVQPVSEEYTPAQLKAMPLEEHAKLARAGYRRNPNNTRVI
jgi:hypothetical protein